MDAIFAIYNFKFSYLLEIKRRRISFNTKLTKEEKRNLQDEIDEDFGWLRGLIHSMYMPWFVLLLLTNIWFLPIGISIFVGITSLIYRKSYMPPLMLLINLITTFCGYFFTVICIVYKLV